MEALTCVDAIRNEKTKTSLAELSRDDSQHRQASQRRKDQPRNKHLNTHEQLSRKMQQHDCYQYQLAITTVGHEYNW